MSISDYEAINIRKPADTINVLERNKEASRYDSEIFYPLSSYRWWFKDIWGEHVA